MFVCVVCRGARLGTLWALFFPFGLSPFVSEKSNVRHSKGLVT